jgi:uncharacterized linocin/CFP29 family protein
MNGDYGVLRPYIGDDGRTYITKTNADGSTTALVVNSGATLRKNEWQKIDEVVVKAARPRLKIVNAMRSAGMTTTLQNAWGTGVLQYERQSDISNARVSMDGLYSGDSDRPVYDLVNLPLPVISKEVVMNSRQIAISRNGNTPLDLSNLELAAIKVAEEAERLVLGTSTSAFTYGGGTVYGFLNFPSRITGTFALPSTSGWIPNDLYNSVIAMIAAATAKYHYGPFRLYYSTGLQATMLKQFSTAYSANSLKGMIAQLGEIQSVEMADYMTGSQLLLVQQTSDVARIVMGMDIQTVQWQEKGGLEERFRVMAMMVPQLKTDQAGNTGIVHYTGV